MIKIKIRNYAYYKLANSMFAGLSIGAIFTIYKPLEPSVFSLGGIALAIALLIVAKFYDKLIELKRFYIISLGVELVMLMMVILYLLYPFGYTTALIVYLGYQLTFTFGSYLIRAETLFVKKKSFLGFIDTYKQIGYLIGLLLSWLFFKSLELLYVFDPNRQIYALHFVLLATQIVIIFSLLRAFVKTDIEQTAVA